MTKSLEGMYLLRHFEFIDLLIRELVFAWLNTSAEFHLDDLIFVKQFLFELYKISPCWTWKQLTIVYDMILIFAFSSYKYARFLNRWLFFIFLKNIKRLNSFFEHQELNICSVIGYESNLEYLSVICWWSVIKVIISTLWKRTPVGIRECHPLFLQIDYQTIITAVKESIGGFYQIHR